MFKRLQKIKNIGRFCDSHSAQAEFDKITLIFGRNTYGKSTLGDLFSSIVSGDASSILKRKTIPQIEVSQTVSFSYNKMGEVNESNLDFNSGNWSPSIKPALNLCVFDDGFYHKNLFVSRLFSRDTKVNFSSFILGAQGVAQAKKIADEKQKKQRLKKENATFQKVHFNVIEDLSAFVKRSSFGDAVTLKKEVEELRDKYKELNKSRKNATEITQRKECKVFPNQKVDLITKLHEFNNVLAQSLENYHKEAKQKVQEHIESHFKNSHNAESWIRQGIEQNNGTSCQFCGQNLGDDALRLLTIYQKNFDDAYRNHEQKINGQLQGLKIDLSKDCLSIINTWIANTKESIAYYIELESESIFVKAKQKLFQKIDSLSAPLIEYQKQLPEFQQTIESLVKKKSISPHLKFEAFLPEQIIGYFTKINEVLNSCNEEIDIINSCFQAFKKSIIDPDLDSKLQNLINQGKEKSLQVNRIELDDKCKEYIRQIEEIKTIEENIPKLEKELNDEQSQYLETFFERLNSYFKSFGSRNFTLEKGMNKQGHTPIYFLKVKFHNQAISERDLEVVFSESDRRALSLSVFWASLDNMTNEEKLKTIVVLDDPITSFDDNRITAVHKSIIHFEPQLRQIIVLSHYKNEIISFLKKYKNNKPLSLLSIEYENNSSHLKKVDIDSFIKNEHEKARDGLIAFSKSQTNECQFGDLRIYLEIEINNRFAKQLNDHSINEQNLTNRIDRLKDESVITESRAQELHNWREILNPAHHTWTDNSLEDKRNTVIEFLDFIYLDLVSIP